jgi:hypothetical protein
MPTGDFMTKQDRDELTTGERLTQQSRKNDSGEDAAEPPEPGRVSDKAKDTKVVRGDDRPQRVRHSG